MFLVTLSKSVLAIPATEVGWNKGVGRKFSRGGATEKRTKN